MHEEEKYLTYDLLLTAEESYIVIVQQESLRYLRIVGYLLTYSLEEAVTYIKNLYSTYDVNTTLPDVFYPADVQRLYSRRSTKFLVQTSVKPAMGFTKIVKQIYPAAVNSSIYKHLKPLL